jgi:branched-subunit amino acid ABC-type transport system permease component
LLITPILLGATGVLIERTMLSRLYKLDHLYGLLLTFGLALIIQGLFRNEFGASGMPYRIPAELTGARNLGFMFLPNYRAWVIVASLVICLATWYVIERTKLGAYLRAATENPQLVQAFGINVPRMITLTYGFGVGLAALAGVMAAPNWSSASTVNCWVPVSGTTAVAGDTDRFCSRASTTTVTALVTVRPAASRMVTVRGTLPAAVKVATVRFAALVPLTLNETPAPPAQV